MITEQVLECETEEWLKEFSRIEREFVNAIKEDDPGLYQFVQDNPAKCNCKWFVNELVCGVKFLIFVLWNTKNIKY